MTRPWATSMRKPSTPMSSQKRRIERNSSRDGRVFPVEVGLLGREEVQVPLAGGAVRARWSGSRPGRRRWTPSRWAAVRRSRPCRGGSGSGRAAAEPGPSAQRALEPLVLVGGVVGHQVDDDPQAQVVGVADQGVGVQQGAEHRVDGPVVGDVVAGVGLRRGVEGAEPDGVHAEVAQVRQPGADARAGRPCRRRCRRRSCAGRPGRSPRRATSRCAWRRRRSSRRPVAECGVGEVLGHGRRPWGVWVGGRGGRGDSGVGWTAAPAVTGVRESGRRAGVSPSCRRRSGRSPGSSARGRRTAAAGYRDQHGGGGHQVPLGVVLADEALQADGEGVLRRRRA